MGDFIQLKYKSKALMKANHKSKEKKIILRHGHIAITNYKKRDNYEFEKSLSVWDSINFKYHLVGGYYVKEMKEFRINRGYNLKRLHMYFPDYTFEVDNDAFPYDEIHVDLYAPPKSDFQRVALTFMASQETFQNLKNYTQKMITAPPGAGKCQPDDTIIPTPDGPKRLDKLNVGDYVFNRFGKPVKILAIYPQKGKRDTYKITFKDGRSTRCSGDHLWRVSTRSGKIKLVSINEIKDDYIGVSKDGKHHTSKYLVELPCAVQYQKQDVPIDPYLLGAFIGNGCLTEKALTISSGNLDVPVEIARKLGLQTSIRKCNNFHYRFIVDSYIDKNDKIRNKYLQTKDFFNELPDMIGAKSGDKYIPDVYKYNTIDIRMEILRGLFDTDGTISKNKYRISYSTTSKRLKNDIVEIIQSLGFEASVKKDKRKKYKTGTCYAIYLMCPDYMKPDFFKAKLKSKMRAIYCAEHYKTRRKDGYLPIVNIEKVNDTKQRCILIDDPDHIYLTENYIPTHNTYCGVASSAFMSSRLVIIVPFTKLLEQWKESLTTFTSIKESEIMIVQGSKACEKIREGKCKNIKAFIFMTDTIASYQEHYGNLAVIDMFYETNAYVKIVDEVHRDLKTITMIDALTNFHMTYYMSATPGRTERKENWIFKELFHNVPKFGEEFEKQDEKHLNVMVKKYIFTPDSRQINKMVNPRVGLNGMLYEKVLMDASEEQRQDFNTSLQVVLNWAKGLLKKGNKIMILAQSVDFLTYLSTIVEEIFPNQWSLYHGGLSKSERKQALEKKVIIATMGTLGTGADIKGLQFLFNCATYSSHITVKQVSGRCRPMKDGTPVVYCELCNYGWLKTVKQFEKRKRYLIERSRTGSIVMIN